MKHFTSWVFGLAARLLVKSEKCWDLSKINWDFILFIKQNITVENQSFDSKMMREREEENFISFYFLSNWIAS